MSKIVLGLDVSSTATGWAIGPIGDRPESGVHRFAPVGAVEDDVWFAAMCWMVDLMKAHRPDVVAIEAAIMTSRFDDETGRPQTNPKTQGLLWGLQAVIRTVVRAKGQRPLMIPVNTARKVFTGRGSYPKGDGKKAVRARCVELRWVDLDERSTDRCDAICIWAAACAANDPAFAANFTPLGTSNVVKLTPKDEVAF